MTLTMGDATHAAVASLPAWLDYVAGYVTGSPDVRWTAADWARFPAQVHVTIDQGFTGSPVGDADVRDVETGAWVPGAAVLLHGWTARRPTIYCNRSTLAPVLDAGWRGDVWLAFPGWQQGEPLPAAPGCTYVAVQNRFDVANAYDLSVILDPTWPKGGGNMAVATQDGWRWCSKCSGLFIPASGGNVCPAGGQHDGTTSFNYSLLNDGTIPGN